MDTTKRLERLMDRYQNGDLDRRTFLGLAAAAAISAGVMTGWSRRALAAAKEVRFDGWGGTTQDAMHKSAFLPYTQKTGVKVVEGTFGDEIDILTKVKTSNPGDFNVIHSSGVDWYKRYVDLGWGSELNEGNIPNLKLVMAPMLDALRKVTPKALSAVPYDYGTSGIAYNTKYISKDEVEKLGPNILLDKRYKGKIAGDYEMQQRVWYGALQSGQDPNNIGDIDAVWAKVRESRDLVKKYWQSGAELQDLLSKEEVILTDAWSGRVAALQEQGFPIAYYDPPGSWGWMEDMFVLKGSPTTETEELLNFMLEPTVSTAVAEDDHYPPSLDPTRTQLSEKVRNLPAFDPTGTLKSVTFADPLYWAPMFD
ncbi:MAG: spermidine/putrescine transport system substrate-binding protein, partial [Rhodospirillaceae bacterium]|nr:spermidine/putrescine transport system substrate-binding protein [Rhodospirillaceae bacterium]